MARQDWHLTMPGVRERLEEIAKEFGVAVLDVSANHSNLPSQLSVSTDAGVGILNIRATEPDDVEEEMRAHFRGDTTDPADVPVIEETKPENLPEEGDEEDRVTPVIEVVTPKQADTKLPKSNPEMKPDTKKGK